MGGTVHGSVDHQTTGANPADRNQEVFTWIYNFVVNQLIGNGYATMIATQYGTAGTGFDYFDGANPSGENAFFVFRMDTSTERPGGGSDLGAYYVLVQWADGTAFGSAPGNPGLIQGSNLAGADGVGIAVAFREDGTSPWAGTTNNNGADTKGATVWTPGTSTLHVLDRSCFLGGAHITNKENTLRVADASTVTRFHIMGDEDSLIFLPDVSDDTTYGLTFAGLYIPLSYVTASYPMVLINTNLPIDPATVWGTLAGSGAVEGALVTADVSGNQDTQFSVTWPTTNLDSTANQPNPQSSTSDYDEMTIGVYAEDNNPGIAQYGKCGHFDLLRNVANVATEQANAALTKADFGNATVSTNKIMTPWGSAGAPRSSSTRAGRQF
jgi:hypothetical protein